MTISGLTSLRITDCFCKDRIECSVMFCVASASHTVKKCLHEFKWLSEYLFHLSQSFWAVPKFIETRYAKSTFWRFLTIDSFALERTLNCPLHFKTHNLPILNSCVLIVHLSTLDLLKHCWMKLKAWFHCLITFPLLLQEATRGQFKTLTSLVS